MSQLLLFSFFLSFSLWRVLLAVRVRSESGGLPTGPTGPTSAVGLNCAVKHTLAVKQDANLPREEQVLFRMLTLSGVQETSAVTTAIPRDLPQHKHSSQNEDLPQHKHSSVITRAAWITVAFVRVGIGTVRAR